MRYKTMKKKDFEEIRLLIERGIAPKIIRAATGRSQGTVGRVNRSKTWEEYQNSLKELNEKYHKKDVLVKELVEDEKPDTHTTATAGDIYVLLERIADALELMEAHWRPLKNESGFVCFRK